MVNHRLLAGRWESVESCEDPGQGRRRPSSRPVPSLAGQEPAVDGCGIPAWGVPLERLAAGWATLGIGRPHSPEGRLLDAMRSEPFFVAGQDRACTRMIKGSTGGTVVKTGAEGVFGAVVPDDGVGWPSRCGTVLDEGRLRPWPGSSHD